MNKYPYIAESNQSKVPWLIYSESLAICLGNELHSYKKINNYDLVEFFSKNITAEYLTNTYGKVESKEHAEFIVKLAEVNNVRVAGKWIKGELFCFASDCEGKPFLSFYPERLAKSDNEKLITIPLPPKEATMSKVQVNVNNNTDSIVQVTKSDDESNIFIHVSDLPKVEEWPAVGCEVLIDSGEHLSELENFNGEKCKIIGICDHKCEKVLTLSHGSLGVAALIMGEWIKKPPTPEDELKQLAVDVWNENNHDFGDFMDVFVNFIQKKQ